MSHPAVVAKPFSIFVFLSLFGALAGIAQAQPDAEIRAQTLIDMSPLLSGYDIRVRALDGRLRLEGQVADEAERRLAVALVERVADAAELDDALRLDAALPDAPGELLVDTEDLVTAARLRQTLSWQKDTAALDIGIEVNRGAVRLNGEVGTTSAKDRIATLVGTTEGVDEVFNYISVDPGSIPQIRERQAELADVERADAWIGSRLRRLFQFDTTVNAHSIEVEVRDASVMLSGAVASSAERKVAEDLASAMLGVRDIDSRLIIERPR